MKKSVEASPSAVLVLMLAALLWSMFVTAVAVWWVVTVLRWLDVLS